MTSDTFGTLRGRFPGWEYWRGVSGLLYARTTRKSPPTIVRADTAELLAARISAAEEPEVSQKSEPEPGTVSIPVPRKALHEQRDGGHSDWYDRP